MKLEEPTVEYFVKNYAEIELTEDTNQLEKTFRDNKQDFLPMDIRKWAVARKNFLRSRINHKIKITSIRLNP